MCGIIGISDSRNAVQLAYMGLFALQHRGQEAAGIVASDGARLTGRAELGLVADAFPESILKTLRGRSAVGHVRYATAGDSELKNAQPLVFDHVHGPIAIAHNGTLTNALTLRRRLEKKGAIFRTTADSEVIVHLIARHKGPIEEAISAALKQVEGAYSLIFLTPDKLIAARDPRGFRPLCLARMNRSHVFASETTALHLMGARFLREIEPGEMVVIEKGHVRPVRISRHRRTAHCVFEQIYFARPDSTVFGRSIQATRRALGRELAKQMAPMRGDLVVPVPDSGVPAAIGYSRECGTYMEMGIVRSHYIGRTFIQPAQVLRDNAVRLKLSPVYETLKGKSIILIDDSIVRGTTSRRICSILRKCGVSEIHMAISSPPIISPCYYGIDTPSKAELLAANGSMEDARRFIGADTLTYLEVDRMLRAVTGRDGTRRDFCTACFTGKYPTPLADFKVGESPRKHGRGPTPMRRSEQGLLHGGRKLHLRGKK